MNRDFRNYHFLANCAAETMLCGNQTINNGASIEKKKCCKGLKCINVYGTHRCGIGIDRKSINIRTVLK